MKKIKLNLPDEVVAMLDGLVEKYSDPQNWRGEIPPTREVVLGSLIKDRAAVSDPMENSVRREIDWKNFVAQNGGHVEALDRMMPKKIWISGFNAGWFSFQTRHPNLESVRFIATIDNAD